MATKRCLYVSNFTAPIIRVMMVSDFLGEDQNADIYQEEQYVRFIMEHL